MTSKAEMQQQIDTLTRRVATLERQLNALFPDIERTITERRLNEGQRLMSDKERAQSERMASAYNASLEERFGSMEKASEYFERWDPPFARLINGGL